MGRISRLSIVLLITLAVGAGSSAAAQRYDIVIEGGRVMDPETGLDAVRNVGIARGKIVRIDHERLSGARVLSARGLVVAPGFIQGVVVANTFPGTAL